MMTIEGILRRRGSELDLFHPKYFESVDKLMDFMVNYQVFLYGYHIVNHSPTSVVVDCKKFIERVSSSDFVKEEKTFEFNKDISEWIVDPILLPQYGYLTPELRVGMSDLRTRFLHALDDYTPKYVSFDQNDHNIVPSFKDGSNDLFISQTVSKFSPKNSLFFVNGLCCKPEESGEAVKLTNGRTYLSNQSDRNRGVVVVDFSSLCNLTYIPLKQCDGTIDDIILPNSIDVEKSSFLLVVDGRLFLPREFSVLSKTTMDGGLVTVASRSIAFDSSKYKSAYAADRLCCSSAFNSSHVTVGKDIDKSTSTTTVNAMSRVYPTRNINVTVPDLKDNDNSFVVVFSKPGLKVVEHECLTGTVESQFAAEEMLNGEPLHHLIFARESAGVLFDNTTRSVIDYSMETNDQTFFTTGNTIPVRWCTNFLRINQSTPLEMWGNYNNDMSASASMHDNKTVRGSATVLWPRYTMLDFIFEGN